MAQSTRRTNPRRVLLWTGAVPGALIILSVVLMGVVRASMNADPSNLDTSSTRTSENGLFNVSYTPSGGDIPVNQAHEWVLHVETASGQPVENARITVDGGMPDHGHGLPDQPQVTEYLGNGDYRVEEVLFQMPGWWVMDFDITDQSESDTVRFNLMLE